MRPQHGGRLPLDGLRQMHAITAGRKHAQRGVEILALIDAIERVGEQNDLTTGLRPDAGGWRHEHVAAEGG